MTTIYVVVFPYCWAQSHIISDGTLTLYENKMTWPEAKQECQDDGMRLAVNPSDEDIRDFPTRWGLRQRAWLMGGGLFMWGRWVGSAVQTPFSRHWGKYIECRPPFQGAGENLRKNVNFIPFFWPRHRLQTPPPSGNNINPSMDK